MSSKGFKNLEGKWCGSLENGCYSKTISFQKHLVRIFDNAIGIDENICNELKGSGCTFIYITNEDDDSDWTIPFNEFLEHSIVRSLGGHAPQRFVSLKFWLRMGAEPSPRES